MKRIDSPYVMARPTRRPLKIFASDPMLGRTAGNRITIDVMNEQLDPGPVGEKIEVIDYDGQHDCFYPAVDLNDENILMQSGLEPAESDPRFHQQMVYAVAMKTIENFERALGRTLHLRRWNYPRLRIFPHAFYGANAYYDSDLHALLFGYFTADRDDPGSNLPGQTVFTCLSHDIITHEMTHALVNKLRRYFLEPSNEDVLAFHEGFSDIVALFQHFTFHDLLRDQIQASRTNIQENKLLVNLANQFGYAIGSGKALRSALGAPDASLYTKTFEPHERGSILVAAVFDAFFATYQKRITDLIRIATNGTGTLPAGDLHPDLVNRVTREATKTAQIILTMCIRAFDYLPPVDITFGDYLRALVTADYELVPDDAFGQRSKMIEAFRVRGIYPENVSSLAEESLLWENAGRNFPRIPIETAELLQQMMSAATSFSRSVSPWGGKSVNIPPSELDKNKPEGYALKRDIAWRLHSYARVNARALCLDPKRKIEVHGFHSVFRVAPDGQLLIELVAQFAQIDDSLLSKFGGLPIRGGTTLVASADGEVRYVIAKPLPNGALSRDLRTQANRRLDRQLQFVTACDSMDGHVAYSSKQEFDQRMKSRMNLAAIHQGAL